MSYLSIYLKLWDKIERSKALSRFRMSLRSDHHFSAALIDINIRCTKRCSIHELFTQSLDALKPVLVFKTFYDPESFEMIKRSTRYSGVPYQTVLFPRLQLH